MGIGIIGCDYRGIPDGEDYRRCGSSYGEEYGYPPRSYEPPCSDQSSSSPVADLISITSPA